MPVWTVTGSERISIATSTRTRHRVVDGLVDVRALGRER